MGILFFDRSGRFAEGRKGKSVDAGTEGLL